MKCQLKVKENASALYSGQLTDLNGDNLQLSDIATLTLTLTKDSSGEVINSRNAQNILNANNVVVDSAGYMTWTIQPADNEVLDDALKFEVHDAVFTWTWGTPVNTKRHELKIEVLNSDKYIGTDIIARIKKRLGEGFRCVELTCDQMDEAVMSALDLLNQYLLRKEIETHANITEQQAAIDYSADNDLVTIVDVQFVRPRVIQQYSDLSVFGLTERAMLLSPYTGSRMGARVSSSTLTELIYQREMVERVRGTAPDYEYDKSGKILMLFCYAGPYDVTVTKGYRYNANDLPSNYMNIFMKAIEAYARMMIADNVGKWNNTIPGPTGSVELDGSVQRDRANTLLQEVTDYLRKMPLHTPITG